MTSREEIKIRASARSRPNRVSVLDEVSLARTESGSELALCAVTAGSETSNKERRKRALIRGRNGVFGTVTM